MAPVYVYVEAPFAAFRTFTAGWYRPTATFLTPSAAYGLLLNAAGVESRLREGEPGHDGKVPATLTRPDVPAAEVAVGVPTFRLVGKDRREPVDEADRFPRVQTVYQQLHNYPVGATGKERAEETKGNKYNITPVRREFLAGVRAVIAVKSEDAGFLARLRQGLTDTPPDPAGGPRYGVPFLGDNAFLLDRLQELTDLAPDEVVWYEKVTAGASGVRDRAARLTVAIDRADLSKTTSHLFAPGDPSAEVPPDAWCKIDPPVPPPPKTR